MGVFEIFVVIATMFCILLAMVPFSVLTWMFFYRVKIRGTRIMKGYFPQVQARRDPAGAGVVKGTPTNFRVTVGDTVVSVMCRYSPASQTFSLYLQTGDMCTYVTANIEGKAGPPFTIRHEKAQRVGRDLVDVDTPPELPGDFVMEAPDPVLAATLWTPAARSAAAHVRGWRVSSDGKVVSGTAQRVPDSVEELEGIVDLVAALAQASTPRP